MSFRTGLLPHLVRATHARPTAPAKRLFHFLPNESQAPRAPPPNPFRSPSPPAIAVAKSRSAPASRLGFRYYAALGLGLSIAYNNLAPKRSLQCQSAPPPTPQVGGGNPPQSILSVYELGFGTVCGICTGVFLKKGLRAIAFLLGGVFVLLQYMSSRSFITVDWARLAGRYDSAFGTKTAEGKFQAPTVGGAWAWFVDFVTANFQQRASFMAGLLLGIRVG